MTVTVCPSVEALKEFRGGRAPEADAQRLEQHLRSCPACVGRLAAAPSDDPLVLGLRAQRGRPRLRNPLLERARQEARGRPFRPALAQHTPGIGSTRPTLAALPEPGEATEAAPAGAFQAIQQTYFFLTPPHSSNELGWLGTYRVLRLLGEGGMGVVLQAEDTRLQRHVALKVMKPLLAADPGSRQRFLREARAQAALEHDHIIAIHAIDEANGVPYLAMPLLQGETLDDRLKRESMLALADVLRVGRETAEGLAAAHAKGLIHRDIKPSNLWLEAPLGRVKILDFGLAAMPVPDGEKTLPGTLLGTPGYMAPEQTEGEADHRADLFSLGCVLYRTATGQPAFPGATPMQKIRSTLFETPRPPQEFNPSLPGSLSHLILRLLARKPEERPATALAVARVLETIEGQSGPGRAPLAVLVPGGPPAAVPVAAAVPPQPLDRRWLLLGGGAFAALFLLILVLAWPSRKGSGPQPQKDDEEAGSKPTSIGRPGAKRSKRPPQAPTPAEDARRDFKFEETWVTRPQQFKGVQEWAIYVDGVGKVPPDAFAFTEDERLLIHYTSSVISMFAPRWLQFDPRTCGLMAAPFDGSYLSLRGDTRMCARAGDSGVKLWEEGNPVARNTLRSPGPMYAAAFSPDGVKIATFDVSGVVQAVRFWDVQKGASLGNCTVASLSLSSEVRGWSPDNEILAVGGQAGVALFQAPWKEATFVKRPQGVTALAWSPDAKLLATVGKDRKIHLLNGKGEVAEEVRLPEVVTPSLVPAWSPDGKELAIATADKKVIVWDRKEKRVTYRFLGHTRPLKAVAYLGDGRTLVSASAGGVRFWDLLKGGLRGTLLNLDGREWVALGSQGYFRTSNNVGDALQFKVLESNEQREFPYRTFKDLYRWENRPERIKLSGGD